MNEKYLEKNYIFLSYSHVDRDMLNVISSKLINDGYRIWYDDGINPGSEWSEDIAIRIEKAKIFLAFITNEYIRSENCRDELSYARENSLTIILVFLKEGVEFPSGMKLRNHRRQQLYYYKYTDKQEFYNKLYKAEGVSACAINSNAKKIEAAISVEEETDSKSINIDSYRALSQKGNAEATYKLANCFETGNQVDMDKSKAYMLYELAKDQGSVEALTALGRFYNYGIACKRNKKKSLKYYLEAAERGDGEALDIIADFYENGDNVRKNKKKSWEFRMKAYEAGNIASAGDIGDGYWKGIPGVVKRDVKKAIQYYEIAISSENFECVEQLVNIYLSCETEFDPQKAERLLLLYPYEADWFGDNWYILGMCYFQGNGVEQDKTKGIEYLKKSVNVGIVPYAAAELGRIYSEGDGTFKNTDLAEAYYEQAANAIFADYEPKILLKSSTGKKKIIKYIGLLIIISFFGFVLGYFQPLHSIINKKENNYINSEKYITKTFSNMKIEISQNWEEVIGDSDEGEINIFYYFYGQNQWDSININVQPYYIGDDDTEYSDYDDIFKRYFNDDIKTKIMLLSGEKGYYVDDITKYDGEEKYTRIYLFIYRNELYQILCFSTNPPSEKFMDTCQRLEDSITFSN